MLFFLIILGTKINDQGYPQNEDIIELQDLRVSPIASIRNRQNSKPNSTIPFDDFDSSKFPPSFRISRPAGYSFNHRIPGMRFRGPKGIYLHNILKRTNSICKIFFCKFLGNSIHKPKVLHAIKKGASVLKASMPKIKDVNIIDKYSRIVFPVTFMLFNAGYWLFYFFE